MPRPLVWYWPTSKVKRPLTCKVYSWEGTCVGAIHYYASVEESDNYGWSGTGWQKPWSPKIPEIEAPEAEYDAWRKLNAEYDAGCKGREFRNKGFTGQNAEKRAINWVNMILKVHFSPETHQNHDWRLKNGVWVWKPYWDEDELE